MTTLLRSVSSNWKLIASWKLNADKTGVIAITTVEGKTRKVEALFADIRALIEAQHNPVYEWVEGALIHNDFMLYHIRDGLEGADMPTVERMHPGQVGHTHLITAWIHEDELVVKCSGSDFDFPATGDIKAFDFAETVDDFAKYAGAPPVITAVLNGSKLNVSVATKRIVYLAFEQGGKTGTAVTTLDVEKQVQTVTLNVKPNLPVTVKHQAGFLKEVIAS